MSTPGTCQGLSHPITCVRFNLMVKFGDTPATAGTGKTVTLVECALQILQAYPHARLLLCAPQARPAARCACLLLHLLLE